MAQFAAEALENQNLSEIPRAVNGLIDAVSSNDVYLRGTAASALGKQNFSSQKECIYKLLNILQKTSDKGIKSCCVDVLGKQNLEQYPDAILELAKTLNDSSSV